MTTSVRFSGKIRKKEAHPGGPISHGQQKCSFVKRAQHNRLLPSEFLPEDSDSQSLKQRFFKTVLVKQLTKSPNCVQ
jgi:hypothetical protein